MGAWVLIFIQVSGFIQPSMNVQPIYFHTKAACDAVAAEFNSGPEPTKDTAREKSKSFAAVCRATN